MTEDEETRGKVLPFCHTNYTLRRRISRECSQSEKEILEKALRDYQLTEFLHQFEDYEI